MLLALASLSIAHVCNAKKIRDLTIRWASTASPYHLVFKMSERGYVRLLKGIGGIGLLVVAVVLFVAWLSSADL